MKETIAEQLSCDGVPPTGPVSPWPKWRQDELMKNYKREEESKGAQATKVKASLGQMARGLASNTKAAIISGKVSEEIREERFATCNDCPSLIKKSNRCSECGCFMVAKTWINHDPAILCPLNKWAR